MRPHQSISIACSAVILLLSLISLAQDVSFTPLIPTSGRILFTSLQESGTNSGIYVMDADGSHVDRLTDNPASDWYPAWSPDGSQIIFQSNRDLRDGLYIMATDGSKLRRVTQTLEFEGDPDWSR